jgi:hypothetical protein
MFVSIPRVYFWLFISCWAISDNRSTYVVPPPVIPRNEPRRCDRFSTHPMFPGNSLRFKIKTFHKYHHQY